MGDINPNPRGWAPNMLFLDLDAIAATWLSGDGRLRVIFSRTPTEIVEIGYCSVESWEDLRNALLIYRSHR